MDKKRLFLLLFVLVLVYFEKEACEQNEPSKNVKIV